jgi:hypothetical protein
MRAHFFSIVLLLMAVMSVVSLLTTKEREYYRMLESSPEDDLASIKAKYRRLALKYHPDRNQYDSTRQMTLLNEAYNYLMIHHNGGVEKTFSAEGTHLLSMILAIWEEIPQEKKTFVINNMRAYRDSEHFGADIVLLINKIFSPEDQSFWLAVASPLIIAGIALMSIGLCTVIYGCYRIFRFVLWLTWKCGIWDVVDKAVRSLLWSARRLLQIILGFVLRLLGDGKSDGQTKQE